jgi:hypothetical protein
MNYTTNWIQFVPTRLYCVEKFLMSDKDRKSALISITGTEDNLYRVEILDLILYRKSNDEWGDQVFSSTDLYAAIHYANNILKEAGFEQLPKKLEILL